MKTGLFDLPAFLFRAVDAHVLGMLPPVVRLLVWGAAGGAAAMLLYRLVSPQKRLAAVKEAAVRARAELAGYDGELDGLGPLAGRTIQLSLLHLGLAIGPALVAALPMLCLFAWLGSAYQYQFPAAGERVTVQAVPATFTPTWDPAAAAEAGDPGTWQVTWPAPDATVEIRDAGTRAAALPPPAPVPGMHKRKWWSVFFGNPAGYLPEGGALEQLTFGLPVRAYLPFGPAWLRGCYVPFCAAVLVLSLGLKLALKIK